jgi:hypothetical protein
MKPERVRGSSQIPIGEGWVHELTPSCAISSGSTQNPGSGFRVIGNQKMKI